LDWPADASLYLIRHGETDWNAEGRLQGGQDIPLNARGRAQAREAAERLAKLVPDLAERPFLCSPMSRARETMDILRAHLGLPAGAYAVDERLSEITFGRWEGLTWPELRAREPVLARAREADKWNYVPPGGESYAMLMERIRPVVASCPRHTVLVSHGGVMRAILAGFGMLHPRQAESLDIAQGRVLQIAAGRFAWR
jgi:probable phosphoglycerate mutase